MRNVANLAIYLFIMENQSEIDLIFEYERLIKNLKSLYLEKDFQKEKFTHDNFIENTKRLLRNVIQNGVDIQSQYFINITRTEFYDSLR